MRQQPAIDCERTCASRRSGGFSGCSRRERNWKQAEMADKAAPFDPYAIVTALERRRVSYVLVGGLARVIHGADEVTHDVDVTPALRPRNLERLREALEQLGSRPHVGDAVDLATAAAETGVIRF